MAAYRADIEIGVKGIRQLQAVRKEIDVLAKGVDSVNTRLKGAVQSLDAYNANLVKAQQTLNKVNAGTIAERDAVRQYVQALGEANAARDRQNRLIQQQIALQRKAVPTQDAGFGLQGPALPPSAAPGRRGGPGRFSNVVLGAGFPLLFGGGPGAVLGGAAGGLVGGPGAFAAQIGLSALGQQLDQFAASAARTGAALNPATVDLDALSEALGLTGTATSEYIRELEKLERQDEALAVATEEMARLVGYDGVRALRDFGSAATDLSNEWSKAMTQMQAALAGLLAGPLQAFANQLESANLYRQAQASSDPRIQELLQQRNRPGILGGSGNRSINDITNEIVELQRKANTEAQKRDQLESTTANTLDQQRRVLEAQLDLAYTDGDLTQDKVYQLKQVVINKEFEVKLQEAINNGTSSELIQLERKVKLQELATQREQALQAAAEKARRIAEQTTRELERQRKEMERMAKLRREQLSEAQRGFVLAELDLGVAATGTDEKARARAEFDRRRAERMFEYTEALQKALSEEERSFLVAKQEVDIFTAKLLLNKELFDIDLQRSKLLNQQDPAATIQEEINLLAAKIQGKEEEYKITKMIADLELAGVTDAADRVGALQGLRAQNEAIETQKQLWADIYTTVAGQLQQAITGLIDGTAEWGDLLSNILGSLGNLFVSAGFNALGGALKLPGFAEGGLVTRPTMAVVGEGGEPEYVIPFSKMDDAMANWADGKRGDAVLGANSSRTSVTNNTSTLAIPFTKSTERLVAERSERETVAAINNPKPLDIRYESSVINGVTYVTEEQHQKGMAQAAERGRALALSALQNSVKSRKRVGMA